MCLKISQFMGKIGRKMSEEKECFSTQLLLCYFSFLWTFASLTVHRMKGACLPKRTLMPQVLLSLLESLAVKAGSCFSEKERVRLQLRISLCATHTVLPDIICKMVADFHCFVIWWSWDFMKQHSINWQRVSARLIQVSSHSRMPPIPDPHSPVASWWTSVNRFCRKTGIVPSV